MANDSRRTDDSGRTTQRAGDTGFSRRRLVVTGGATWTALGVAGCCTPPETPTEEPTEEPTETVTVTQETTTTDDTPGGDQTPTETPTATATPTGTPCEQEVRFLQGQEIGFLVAVYRTRTGEVLGPEAVASVRVRFASDDVASGELSWEGRHNEVDSVDDDTWGGTLSDTSNLDTGTYRYDVVVTTEDGTETVVTDKVHVVSA